MKKETIGFAAIAALLSVASIFSIRAFTGIRTDHDSVNINSFPYKIDSWQGEDIAITEKDYDILETRNILLRDYKLPGAKDGITLFIVYSETNRSVFHPPEVCMIGSGMKILNKTSDDVAINGKEGRANKIYTERNGKEEMVLYCYKAGDLYTDNFYLHQIRFAFNQLLGERKAGATIRVSMPIKGGEEETSKLLKHFMKRTVNIIEKM